MLTKLERSINNFRASKSYNNDAHRFLPINTKGQDINWILVRKSIYEDVLGVKCDVKDPGQLFEKIVEDLSASRETRDLTSVVENVYLNENTLSSLSPYLNLICNDKPNQITRTLVSVFSAMLSTFEPVDIDFTGANFVEGLINSSIKRQCVATTEFSEEAVYLPFLAHLLNKDLRTLSSNPEWFTEEFDDFIKLYTFLYLAQLSLHLGTVNERFNEPVSRELFFILETETASKERHECNIKGFNSIFGKPGGFGLKIFSNLGYLEQLSELPIWKFTDQQTDHPHTQEINTLNQLLCNQFEIKYEGDKSSIEGAINDGLYYHLQLFKEGSNTSTRSDANDKVFNTFKDVLAQNFISDRKKAGYYLQLTTKTTLMVTNLIIGNRGKLLIADVIEGFKERGIYFDLKSRNALLKVYKNIGNVEKLSDSGDAVYVKSTI